MPTNMTLFLKTSSFIRIFLWIATVGVLGKAQKIAVIGGGVSGTFTTKYLSDYDTECQLDSITVFEPLPVDKPIASEDIPDEGWQGSRVASFQLKDGSIVELGASVGYNGFHLVLSMIHGDPSIEIGAPFNTGRPDENLREGMGIYDGHGRWPLLTSMLTKFFRKFQILGRYNMELL
jgi:prenylcysteine oxidase/farnesylcysteine lyase